MKWSRVLLVAVIILLPLVRPAGPRQTALADGALIALVPVTLLILWRTRRPLRTPLAGPHWLIWTGSLIATLASANAVGCVVTLIQDVYIYSWFIMACNAIEPDDLPWLGRAWVVMALVESGLIVLGAFAGVGALANEWGRGVGTFINPNMAASYIVTSFFVYLATPFPRSRALRVAGGALILMAALATGSNAGLIALATGLVAMLAHRLIVERRNLWPWLGLTALAGAAFCLLLLLSTPSSGLAALEDLSGAGGLLLLTVGRLGRGLASRGSIWFKGWLAFQRYPSGLGPGTSQAGLGGELHNDFLAHLVERGALGLAGLLWAVGATFACFWKMARVEWEDGRRLPLALGPLLAGFVAALPVMLSHEILHFRHHWMFLAIVFAQAPLGWQGWRQTVTRVWAWTRYSVEKPGKVRNGRRLQSRTSD